MKKHYFLIAGELTFVTNEEHTGQVRMNTVVQSDDTTFPVRLIGKAQQSLQLHFFKKIGDATEAANTNVIDVVLLNVSYLGEMTEEEFQAAPEGMAIQERQGGLTPTVN